MSIMKRKILVLFLAGSILLTACGKKAPLPEQKPIAKNEVGSEVNGDLYSNKVFDTSMSLTVKAYIPETFSNLLISYKKDGKIYRYYVVSNMSGEGSDANLQRATI